MCTVSFVNISNTLVFTSTRDEHLSRAVAKQPHVEKKNEVSILFPKDIDAGGTWFAVNELGTICILLNGAYTNYKRKNGYKKSRGLVVLDVVSTTNPIKLLKALNLHNIAPFTLVLYHNNLLFQFRWDGLKLYQKLLSEHLPNIWSSATLFNFEEQHSKRYLFQNHIQKHNPICPESLLALHKTPTHLGGFCINRPSGHRTVSVSQAIVNPDRIQVLYYDVLKDDYHEATIQVTQKASKE